jgi:hypothetical protein
MILGKVTMPRFLVSGLAELECRDALTAWQEAHRHADTLPWEVASISPIGHPAGRIDFDTNVQSRAARARMRRGLVTAAVFLVALAFPSHLVASSLLSGRW